MAIKDHCGLFGVYNSNEASALTFLGLFSLQHRGEESCGIISYDGTVFTSHKGMGLVDDVFNEDSLKKLKGHQAIGHAFGGRVVRAGRIMHGKTSPILNDGRTIFQGLPSPFPAGRYHSLIVERESLPDCLEVSAETEEGEIMGLRHRTLPVEGIQFHPESILTPGGKRIIRNFLQLIDRKERCDA